MATLNEPTQFQVSSKLIASKDFRGINGLIMRAASIGDYEPCVQALVMIQKRIYSKKLISFEDHVRSNPIKGKDAPDEPFIQSILLIQKQYHHEGLMIYERYMRSDLEDDTPYQRSRRVLYEIY